MPQTESQRTHTPQRTHTLQSKSPKTKRTILQTRLTLVSSLLPQAAHCNTHVHFMEATQDTHTHTHTRTRRPEVAVKIQSGSLSNSTLAQQKSVIRHAEINTKNVRV